MTTRQQFSGEVMLLGWADTSTRGKTVTFQLHPDEAPGDHPFKNFGTGKTGQRFALVAVPIDDDSESPTAATGSPSPPATPASPTNSSRASQAGGALAKRAGILCSDIAFRRWIVRHGEPLGRTLLSSDDAADYVREYCGVSSRAELDHRPEAGEKFIQIETEFMRDDGRLPEVRG